MVVLKGPNGQTASITDADLQALPRHSVTVAWGGGHTYAGALVSDLLGKVGGRRTTNCAARR